MWRIYNGYNIVFINKGYNNYLSRIIYFVQNYYINFVRNHLPDLTYLNCIILFSMKYLIITLKICITTQSF